MTTLDAARAPNRHLLVHIEGVNFDATVWDVNDLATQRGASLALLNAPRALVYAAFGTSHVDEIFTGASIGRYLVRTDDTVAGVEESLRALIASPKPCSELSNILPHLSFVVAAVDPDEYCGNMAIARRTIIAKARRAQLQTPTVVAPASVSHKRLCKLNPMLPAASASQDYSASIDARRQYGRQQKQAFYGHLGVTLDDGAVFAREMDDLVRDSPKHVRETICNKVAHVYLDGNDFTAIREGAISGAVDDPLGQERKFSTFVAVRRTRLLKCLIGALSKCQDMFTEGKDAERVFRWETLLWGGDEAAFVAPAWILPRLLDLLAEELKVGWDFNGTALTHKCGIYITDRKTPIVLARRLAGALGDSAKQPGVNTVQIMVSESVDPPVDVTRIDPVALRRYRASVYGVDGPENFTLDLLQAKKFIQGFYEVQAVPGGLPRSQLWSILRGDGENLHSAFERSGATCAGVFEQEIFGAGGHPLLPYRRIAELLDYFPRQDV